MRATLPIGLSLMILFSGCFGGGDDDPEPTDSTTATTGTGTATPTTSASVSATTTAPGANQAPTAVLQVLGADGVEISPEDGKYELPANADFIFDASDSSDPDGDALTYKIEFSDGAGTASTSKTNRTFTAGNYTAKVTVSDPKGLKDEETATLVVKAAATTPGFYFFDDADTPTTWTFSQRVYVNPNAPGVPPAYGDEEHPTAAGWHTTTKEKVSKEKSWTMQDEEAEGYHDNEITNMTSAPIDLTTAKAAKLTFQHKGDSEKNDIDGLYWAISKDGGATFAQLGTVSGKVADWTLVEVDLAPYLGNTVQLRFTFKSDISCSIDTALPQGCGVGAYTGYFVDDIKVA